MAHKLLDLPIKEGRTKQRFVLPQITGRFGISLYVGSKEIFIGINISQVEQEVIVKKRFVKTQKGTVKVFRFD